MQEDSTAKNAEDAKTILVRALLVWHASPSGLRVLCALRGASLDSCRNWHADVRAFDAAYAHILAMSDALADGIVKQFPDKFADAPTPRK